MKCMKKTEIDMEEMKILPLRVRLDLGITQ